MGASVVKLGGTYEGRGVYFMHLPGASRLVEDAMPIGGVTERIPGASNKHEN